MLKNEAGEASCNAYASGAQISVDGAGLRVTPGRMLAAVLMEAGIRKLRASPRAGTPQGAFCLMGSCQECAIHVDGKLVLACQVAVQDGMVVELRGAGT